MAEITANEAELGFFGRYLTLWVALCMVAGVMIGIYIPIIPAILAKFEYANVSIPVAVLIWLMIYPMMLKIDFSSVVKAVKMPKGLFVWSHLTKGNPAYTLVQVAVNDLIILFAFTPIVAFLLGVSGIAIPWDTLIISVVLFVVIPLTAGWLTRRSYINSHGEDAFNKFVSKFDNITTVGLLLTLVIIFSFQGRVIINNPTDILLIAIPLTIQTILIFGVGYLWSWGWKLPHDITGRHDRSQQFF